MIERTRVGMWQTGGRDRHREIMWQRNQQGRRFQVRNKYVYYFITTKYRQPVTL